MIHFDVSNDFLDVNIICNILLRKVWRYLMGTQKGKGQKDKNDLQNTTQKNRDWVTQIPLSIGDELVYYLIADLHWQWFEIKGKQTVSKTTAEKRPLWSEIQEVQSGRNRINKNENWNQFKKKRKKNPTLNLIYK